MTCVNITDTAAAVALLLQAWASGGQGATGSSTSCCEISDQLLLSKLQS